MRIGAVIHARMSSERFPGKVLARLAGDPALKVLAKRLSYAETLTHIIIATSKEETDDPIEEFCKAQNFKCFRGSLENVAHRVLSAAQVYDLDVVVRVNGDSPLLDQRLIDQGVRTLVSNSYDMVTNVHPRSFPPGQSVEVFQTECLRQAVCAMTDPYDQEHVTSWLYKNEKKISIRHFSPPKPTIIPSFTLDTKADLIFLAKVVDKMTRPQWEYTWEELVAIAEMVTC